MLTIKITREQIRSLYNGKEAEYETFIKNDPQELSQDFLDKMLLSILMNLKDSSENTEQNIESVA